MKQKVISAPATGGYDLLLVRLAAHTYHKIFLWVCP